jgi:hypothetical protein
MTRTLSVGARCTVLSAALFSLLSIAPAQAQERPPVAAPAAPASDAKPLFRFYGILKPTVVVGNGLESFGQTNFVATTAAANPLFVRSPDAVALSMQVQQTRFGVAVGEGTPLKGQLEIDFVDFSRSSPAQSTPLRLRQAFVEWTPALGHKLTLGQLWDVFSPLNSHMFDIVGGAFQAGNSGFMRHQLIYTRTLGRFEGTLALGLTSQNLSAALGNVEYGRVPTIAPRLGYRVDKRLWIGVAGMFTRLSFDGALPTEQTRIAAGGNAFAELSVGPVQLRAEAYGGSNLENLGMLVLGHGAKGHDVQELGGFVSAKATLSAAHALHVVVSGAGVLNPSDLPLGYTPAVAATDSTAAVSAARVGANGPGIVHNESLRVGYGYTPLSGFTLVCEPFVIHTKHKLAPADAARFAPTRTGWGVQAGGMYTF